MAIEFPEPVQLGGTAKSAKKTRIVIDPAGTIDIELTYGNYAGDGTFVPASPVTQKWVKIEGEDFLAFGTKYPDGAKTYWANISDDLDVYISKRGLA